MKLETVSVALFLLCLANVMAEEVDFSVPDPAVRNWNAAQAAPVSSATKVVSAAPEGPVLWADSSTPFGHYGDEANGASVEFDTSGDAKVIHIKTDTGWGCGIFNRPRQPHRGQGRCDRRHLRLRPAVHREHR